MAQTRYPQRTFEKKIFGDADAIAPYPCAIMDIATSSLVSQWGVKRLQTAITVSTGTASAINPAVAGISGSKEPEMFLGKSRGRRKGSSKKFWKFDGMPYDFGVVFGSYLEA